MWFMAEKHGSMVLSCQSPFHLSLYLRCVICMTTKNCMTFALLIWGFTSDIALGWTQSKEARIVQSVK